MSEDDHAELLSTLKSSNGMIVLSGYDSDLYNDLLSGWCKEEKVARISAAKGTGLKTECLWINPYCSELLNERDTIGIRHTSHGAYVTHHIRKESTEQQISKAIDEIANNGNKVTKSGVAKIVGMSREHISRNYAHMFAT